MPEITGLDKHLLRRGGPGWPSLSSTVVLVYCFFPPSSIYSSVLLNVLGVGRWWVRCDGSTKAACTERDEITFWHTRGLGERKHTNAHLHVCKHSGAYKAQTSLFVHHCVYVTIIWICWQIWSTETCEYVYVCPCVPVCLGYQRSFAIDCVFCQISFARTKQRSYDACLASRLHIQFI